jgi:predicted ArsR family transcriptional regulator
MSYPFTPGFKDDDTSKEAASKTTDAKNRRELVMWALNKWGPMTADQCAHRLGIGILGIRPRFSELVRLKRIYDTGKRGVNESGMTAKIYATLENS